MQIRESKAAVPQVEGTTPTCLPGAPFRLVPLGEGRYSFEAVTHGVEVYREEFVEAIAEYFATIFVDLLITDATEVWHTESGPRDRDRRCHGRVSGWLQITVDTSLKGLLPNWGYLPAKRRSPPGYRRTSSSRL
jgi:hypothetical protein